MLVERGMASKHNLVLAFLLLVRPTGYHLRAIDKESPEMTDGAAESETVASPTKPPGKAPKAAKTKGSQSQDCSKQGWSAEEIRRLYMASKSIASKVCRSSSLL